MQHPVAALCVAPICLDLTNLDSKSNGPPNAADDQILSASHNNVAHQREFLNPLQKRSRSRGDRAIVGWMLLVRACDDFVDRIDDVSEAQLLFLTESPESKCQAGMMFL